MSDDVYRMDLTRPVEAHGETHSDLELRDPDSGALDGVKFTYGPDGLTINMGDMPRLISAAAGIPLSSARTIRMGDIIRHAAPILSFFGTDTPTTGGS